MYLHIIHVDVMFRVRRLTRAVCCLLCVVSGYGRAGIGFVAEEGDETTPGTPPTTNH